MKYVGLILGLVILFLGARYELANWWWADFPSEVMPKRIENSDVKIDTTEVPKLTFDSKEEEVVWSDLRATELKDKGTNSDVEVEHFKIVLGGTGFNIDNCKSSKYSIGVPVPNEFLITNWTDEFNEDLKVSWIHLFYNSGSIRIQCEPTSTVSSSSFVRNIVQQTYNDYDVPYSFIDSSIINDKEITVEGNVWSSIGNNNEFGVLNKLYYERTGDHILALKIMTNTIEAKELGRIRNKKDFNETFYEYYTKEFIQDILYAIWGDQNS